MRETAQARYGRLWLAGMRRLGALRSSLLTLRGGHEAT
jgi:hypothetical protein